MELIRDYECILAYHPGKANVVAYALSIKNLSKESKERITFLEELEGCKAILRTEPVGNLIARFQVKLTLEEEIVKTQSEDHALRKLTEEVRCEWWSDYTFRYDDALIKEKRLCIPNNKALKESILKEVHSLVLVVLQCIKNLVVLELAWFV